MPKNRKIEAAIKLLKENGYAVEPPTEPKESEYEKAIRTGVRPDIWPPIVMTREELNHFRASNGLA